MAIRRIARVADYGESVAIADSDGEFSYARLLQDSARVASALLEDEADLGGERVAFLVAASYQYPAVQWGIWRAGGIAVPLCLTHPEPELARLIADCGARILVASSPFLSTLRPIADRFGCRLWETRELLASSIRKLPEIGSERPAMIVYTSGTTGGPKGVVTSHRNLEAQIASLIEAWEWVAADRILLVLPLHHVHGIINVLGCSLAAGATCEMMPRFDAAEVWERMTTSGLTLFMAVPTIYSRLASAWESADHEIQARWSGACRRLRLMVSGSAALPVELFDRWQEISGHRLLERYGMTEIGMALSNPLHGDRVAGHVGQPLPGVEVRLVDDSGARVQDGQPGEIEVRGAGVFLEYWDRPRETVESFRSGWFRTGDLAVVERGSYRILGRQSVDIIKTGGYKVSALEIEEVLCRHSQIRECAVVGVPDPEWGERVAAAVVARDPAAVSLDSLRRWSKKRLAPYKAPSRLLVLEQLPRNAMGKVIKPDLKKMFSTDSE